MKAEWIEELERDCDEYLTRVEKLRSFILPGGSPGAAYLHLATTITRRAERSTWAAIEEYGTEAAAPVPEGEEAVPGGINPLTAKYLNRLSDLLFILARVANVSTNGSADGGDVLWQPGGGREEITNPKRRQR